MKPKNSWRESTPYKKLSIDEMAVEDGRIKGPHRGGISA